MTTKPVNPVAEWTERARAYEKKIRDASVKSLMNAYAIETMRYTLRVALDMLGHELRASAQCRRLLADTLALLARMNEWFGANPDWDLHQEPPWAQDFYALQERITKFLQGGDL